MQTTPRQTYAPAVQRAALFNTSAKAADPEVVQEKEVPVVSYKDGQRSQEEIHVEKSGTGPVSPPGQDLETAAQPLNPQVLKHLTPTLHKFTLPGKVAVVTG